MPIECALSALSRFTVLDLTRVRSGPTCVRELTDWGANVIKIKTPPDLVKGEALGDDARSEIASGPRNTGMATSVGNGRPRCGRDSVDQPRSNERAKLPNSIVAILEAISSLVTRRWVVLSVLRGRRGYANGATVASR